MKSKNLQTRLLNTVIIQNQRIDKQLPRQEKAKGVHDHQSSIVRSLKGSSLIIRKRQKQMVINTYLLTISLNANGLNAPIKRHTVAEWIRKQDLYICCLKETHFCLKETH